MDLCHSGNQSFSLQEAIVSTNDKLVATATAMLLLGFVMMFIGALIPNEHVSWNYLITPGTVLAFGSMIPGLIYKYRSKQT